MSTVAHPRATREPAPRPAPLVPAVPHPHAARVLLALWVLAVGALWWAAPRPATNDQLRADALGHSIVSLDRVSQPPRPFPASLAMRPQPPVDPTGDHLRWTTPDQRTRWISIAQARPVLDELAAREDPRVEHHDDAGKPLQGDERGVAALSMVGLRGGWHVSGLAVVVSWLALQGVMYATPTRARSHACWLWASFLPAGLGLLWFVHDELLGRPALVPGLRNPWAMLAVLCLATPVLEWLLSL